MVVDYAALAKAKGGSTQPSNGTVDYGALAKANGAISSTPAPSPAAPATPPKSIFQHLLDGGSAVADALGLNDAVDTMSSSFATLAHPKLAARGLIDPPTIGKTLLGGAELGLNTAGLETGGPKAVSAIAKLAGDKVAATAARKVLETVAPKMTAKETADALATQGGTRSGMLGKIKVNLSPSVLKIADAVTQHVPDFNPSKSLVENVNATKEAIGTLASDLKNQVVQSGKDRIYSFKELGSALRSAEKPTLLVGDLEKVHGKVLDKMMQIARDNGGKVSDLFDARKEFDQFISREFPYLYSSDTLTPMRVAVKKIRNTVNDFIAQHLPEDIHFHDSLLKQSRLFDAVENMSEKAAAGATKEVGTNAIERFGKNHPVLKKAVVGGAAAIGADKVLKDITGVGL
jgi:hypothetical protein